MDADRKRRMTQLENVLDWLTEMQEWIADDAGLAAEEGDTEGVLAFKAESDVVRKLRGAAQFEFDEMRKLESLIAYQKLRDWELAMQRRSEANS